jgi:hypothetical protein
MEINLILNKYVVYTMYAMLVLTFTSNIKSCSTNKEVNKLRKEVDSLSVAIDKMNSNSYSKDEQNIRMAIEGYEISKRMLYDQNAIVRTTVRPDDRINEYDSKIKELREKIK